MYTIVYVLFSSHTNCILSHHRSTFIRTRGQHYCLSCSVTKSTISTLEHIKHDGRQCPGTGWRDTGQVHRDIFLVYQACWLAGPLPTSSRFPPPGRIREALFACFYSIGKVEELSDNDLSRDDILRRTKGWFFWGGRGRDM